MSFPAAPPPPPAIKVVQPPRGSALSLDEIVSKKQLKSVPAIVKTIQGVGKIYEIGGQMYEMATKDGASAVLNGTRLEVHCFPFAHY